MQCFCCSPCRNYSIIVCGKGEEFGWGGWASSRRVSQEEVIAINARLQTPSLTTLTQFPIINTSALLSVTRVRCSRPRGIDIPSDHRQGTLSSGTPMARSVSVFGPLEGTPQAARGVPTSGSLPCHLYEATVTRSLLCCPLVAGSSSMRTSVCLGPFLSS